MSTVLQELLPLFEIDQKLLRCKKQLVAGPAAVREQEERIEVARAERKQAEDIVRTKSAEVDQCNLDMRTAESEIEDLERKLKGIKNNKEYKIVTERIKEMKRQIDENESRALAVMEELDQLRSTLREKLTAVEEAEKKIQELKAEIEEDAKTIKAEVRELKVERAAQIEKVNAVDPTVMETYNAALRRGQGTALAEMVGNACQACFRQANINTENTVLVGRDIKKCLCAGCGRILYSKQAISSGTAPDATA